MKNNNIRFCIRCLIALVFFPVLHACTHDYMAYDTELKDGIYLMTADTVRFDFDLSIQGSTYDYILGIRILGMPAEADRAIELVVDDTASTAVEGVHYEWRKAPLITSGEIQTMLPITLIRDRDTSLAAHPVVLTLQLKENEAFRLLPGMAHRTTLIISSEAASQPFWWQISILGPYSEQLHRDFLYYYKQIEAQNPTLFATLSASLGENLDGNMMALLMMWGTYRIPLMKYVVMPMYEYYQQYPDPRVQIPEPSYN